MARPRLVLHIGFGKCGSTALQRFLLRAQDDLRAEGVVLVDQKMAHPGAGRATGVAQVRMGPLLAEPEAGTEIPAALQRLARDMAFHGEHTALLSCESLSNSHHYPAFFAGLRDLFEIRVLAYLRPQEDLLPSYWKQSALRQGHGFETFVAQAMRFMTPNYLLRLTAWKRLLGAENLSVGSIRREALRGGDLFEDACHRLGLPHDRLAHARPDKPVNPTFDHHLLSVLAEAPHLLEGANMGQLYNYLEAMLHPSGFSHGRNPLSQARRAEIHAHYEAQNRELVAGFMPGTAYEDAFGAGPAPREKDVSDDLAQATARSLAYTLDLLRKQHTEMVSLRTRIGRLEAALAARGPDGTGRS